MRGRTVLILGMIAAAVAGCDGGSRSSRFLSLGTAGTGGIYYPLGGAIASRLSLADPDRQFTAEVTGGALENVARVANGEMELAMATGNTIYDAFHRPGEEARYAKLRVIAPLYPNVIHILVSGRSNITSIKEFRGKRISVGSPGSGTEESSRDVLRAAGLSYDDVNQQFLSFTETASALRDGSIEGAIISVGYPASAVLEAMTGSDVRLISMDSDIIDGLVARHPYYTQGMLPSGAYPRLTSDLQTVVLLNWIISLEDLDDSVATLVLDVLQKDRDELIKVADIMNQVDLNSLRTPPVPLHPAADRWMRIALDGGATEADKAAEAQPAAEGVSP